MSIFCFDFVTDVFPFFFRYSFIVAILALGYSALQLIKGISDMARKGFFVTEKVSDYATFIFDQVSNKMDSWLTNLHSPFTNTLKLRCLNFLDASVG